MKIELWTDAGISYEEVVNRLSERSDRECLEAVAMMMQGGAMREAGIKIAMHADTIRDSRKILDLMEPILMQVLSGQGVPIELHAPFLELHALVVEGYVRQASILFPIHGQN